jgi:hypothetical protein
MNGTVPRHMSLMVIAEPVVAQADPGIIEEPELVEFQFEVSGDAWDKLQEMAVACGVDTRGVFDCALSLFTAAFEAKASGEGYIAIVDRATEAINPLLIPQFSHLERLRNSKQ